MAVDLCAASAVFTFVCIGTVNALVRDDRRYAHCPHLLSALSAERWPVACPLVRRLRLVLMKECGGHGKSLSGFSCHSFNAANS